MRTGKLEFVFEKGELVMVIMRTPPPVIYGLTRNPVESQISNRAWEARDLVDKEWISEEEIDLYVNGDLN